MSNYDLRDAFQELVALNEAEEFNLSDEEQIKKMADFMDGDEYDEVQMVIDVDAEGMDDLEPSYEGKIILQCPVCKSLIYKDEADIVEDSDSDYVNVEEHCPYCKEEGGMIIVGKVAPYPTHEEEKVEEPADDSAEEPVESEEETEVETEEPVQESLTEEVGVQKFGDEDDPERYHSANWYIGGRNNFELSTDALGGAKRGDAVRYTASRWSHTYHNIQEMEDDIKNLQTLINEVKKLEAKGFVNSELNESLNEDANGELAMAELKDLVAMHIYNRYLADFDDNLAREIAKRIPEYDIDWCNEEGDNFIAKGVDQMKHSLARKVADALFANAPRELPECLTESDMPAEESENIVYRDSRRNNFYLWRNGKRYEAETIEKLKEILKSKNEDCKLKEGEVCPKCGKSPCECKECADTKLTEASEVIDRKGFATLIKYSDPVFANASHGVLNDGNFCYKFWAKDDDEAKKIFAERGVECDESLEESTKGTLDYDEAVDFVEDAGISLDVAGSDFADYIIDDFEALEDENGKFSKADLKKFIAYAKKKAKELEDEDLYEDLDTESLDKLVSEKLGKTYVTESGYVDGNKITVEGKLGKEKVSYVFEARRGGNKVALLGEKFALKGRLENKNIICEDIADSFKEIADGLAEVAGQVRQAADDVEFEAEQVRVGAEEIEKNEAGEEAAEKINPNEALEEECKEEELDESKPPYGNPNFDEDKYGKYFDDNNKLIPELADEYFALISKQMKEIDEPKEGEDLEECDLQETKMSSIKGSVGDIIKNKIFPRMEEIDNKEELIKVAEEELANVDDKAKAYAKEVLDNLKKKDYYKAAVYLGNVMLAGENLRSPDAKKLNSSLEEATLTEKKWEVRLESGKALRQAIDGEDGEEIKEALKNCYKEINRKMPEEFDEDELESMLDDLDMADFSENEEVGVDAEEAEDNVNAYLGDFYDFCDGYNIWVEI